jgi:hypothetical protein
LAFLVLVFPSMVLKFADVIFVVAIVTQGATLTLTGEASLLVLIGGLWAIFAGVIFPARRTLKPKTTNQSVQQQNHQQPQTKSIRQDRFKLFTSNLSIHSQYFQFALALAITNAVGLLIAQWLKLQEPDWVLISIVVILMPTYNEIFLISQNASDIKLEHYLFSYTTKIGKPLAGLLATSIPKPSNGSCLLRRCPIPKLPARYLTLQISARKPAR